MSTDTTVVNSTVLTFLLTIISILLGALFGLLVYIYRGAMERIDKVAVRIDTLEVHQHNFIRSIFVLLHRLYPEKGITISDTMVDMYEQQKKYETKKAAGGRL